MLHHELQGSRHLALLPDAHLAEHGLDPLHCGEGLVLQGYDWHAGQLRLGDYHLVREQVSGEHEALGRGLERGKLYVRTVSACNDRFVGRAAEVFERALDVHGAYLEVLHELVKPVLPAYDLTAYRLVELPDGYGVKELVGRQHAQERYALLLQERPHHLLYVLHPVHRSLVYHRAYQPLAEELSGGHYAVDAYLARERVDHYDLRVHPLYEPHPWYPDHRAVEQVP